jgi:hypothetical protein
MASIEVEMWRRFGEKIRYCKEAVVAYFKALS